MNKKNIVIIGGGTASAWFLKGWAKLRNKYNISVVATMADNGGSNGRIQRDQSVTGFGAIRKCLLALSEADEEIKNAFGYRFEQGELSGHVEGNIFMAALEKTSGSAEKTLAVLNKMLKINGKVIPVSFDKVTLFAELENGEIIEGETKIDIPEHDGNLKITKVCLRPKAKVNPEALKEIKKADFIIIGPGDFYTTIVPNFLVEGISGAIKKSKARKLFIVNSYTKYGETHNFSVNDFVRSLEKYLGADVLDYVLYNGKNPGESRMKEFHPRETFPELTDDKELLSRYKFIDNWFVEKEGLLYFNRDKVIKLIIKLLKK